MLNIILWGLDSWTVFGTFMSTIGESPSGLYLMSAFAPLNPCTPLLCLKLSCTSLLAKQRGANHETNQPFQFAAIFNALKKWWRQTNYVWDGWGGEGGGVSVCHGWAINVTKRQNLSRTLKHYLLCCLIGWWRLLNHCPWYIAAGRNGEGNNVVTRGHKGKGKKLLSSKQFNSGEMNSPIWFLPQSSKIKHFILDNDDWMMSWLDGNLHALDWD